MNWKEIQDLRNYAPDDELWAICFACGKRVHQGVGTLHIQEEHPEIAKSITDAITRSINLDKKGDAE